MIGIGIGVGVSRMRDLASLIRNMLFGSGEVGVMYDLSDRSALFQDSAGTTPVTAVEQPVGLLLDKSKELVLGATEFVTNGNFDTDLTGWTTGVVGSTGTAEWVSGAIRLTNTSFYGREQSITTVVGKTYKISASITAVSGLAAARVLVTTAVNRGGTILLDSVASNVPKEVSGYFKAIGTTTYISLSMFTGTAGVTADFDNISVRELPGNHATQATTASKPLSATNSADFDGIDDKMLQSAGGGSTTAFMLCAGLVLDGVGTVQTIWSDAGTNTGYAVRVNASNQLEILAGDGTAYTTCATTDTVSASTPFVATVWDDSTNLNAQINNRTVVSVARPVVAAGTSTATIGSSNAATANVLNGKPFQIIQTKNDAGTDAERAATKAYIAGKIGVTL